MCTMQTVLGMSYSLWCHHGNLKKQPSGHPALCNYVVGRARSTLAQRSASSPSLGTPGPRPCIPDPVADTSAEASPASQFGTPAEATESEVEALLSGRGEHPTSPRQLDLAGPSTSDGRTLGSSLFASRAAGALPLLTPLAERVPSPLSERVPAPLTERVPAPCSWCRTHLWLCCSTPSW